MCIPKSGSLPPVFPFAGRRFSALGFPFEAEQVGLGLQSARIADQSAAAANHAVAGDDDGDSGYGGLKVFERVFDHLLPDIGRVVGLHRMVLVGVDHHVVLLAAAVQARAISTLFWK